MRGLDTGGEVIFEFKTLKTQTAAREEGREGRENTRERTRKTVWLRPAGDEARGCIAGGRGEGARVRGCELG